MTWAWSWVTLGVLPTARAAASNASLMLERAVIARARSRPAPAAMEIGTQRDGEHHRDISPPRRTEGARSRTGAMRRAETARFRTSLMRGAEAAQRCLERCQGLLHHGRPMASIRSTTPHHAAAREQTPLFSQRLVRQGLADSFGCDARLQRTKFPGRSSRRSVKCRLLLSRNALPLIEHRRGICFDYARERGKNRRSDQSVNARLRTCCKILAWRFGRRAIQRLGGDRILHGDADFLRAAAGHPAGRHHFLRPGKPCRTRCWMPAAWCAPARPRARA